VIQFLSDLVAIERVAVKFRKWACIVWSDLNKIGVVADQLCGLSDLVSGQQIGNSNAVVPLDVHNIILSRGGNVPHEPAIPRRERSRFKIQK